MIYLNGKTNRDYKCDFTHFEVSSPEVKTELVEVPLRSGFINAARYLSDIPTYAPRTVTIGLELRPLRMEWANYYTMMMNDLHGQEVEIISDTDPGWYWVGIASVGALDDHGASAGITIEVTAQPYKRRIDIETFILEQTLSGEQTFTINISDPIGYPIITTGDSGFRVTMNGETWSLPEGESEAYGLVLPHGETELTISGSGTFMMRVQGGSL